MKTPSLAALLLCLGASAHAAPTALTRAQAQACENRLADLTTREQMFAIFPPDPGGAPYVHGELGFDGQKWTRYPRSGGSISVGANQHDIFRTSLAAHCDKVAAEMAKTAQAARAAAERAKHRAQGGAVVQNEEGLARTMKALKSNFASSDIDPTMAPDVKPACPPQVCTGLADCRDAGMGANNLGSDFRCRELAAQARNVCTCP